MLIIHNHDPITSQKIYYFSLPPLLQLKGVSASKIEELFAEQYKLWHSTQGELFICLFLHGDVGWVVLCCVYGKFHNCLCTYFSVVREQGSSAGAAGSGTTC